MTNTIDEHAGFVEIAGDLRGYYARPGGTGPFPGVLVFQEAFGVNEYIASEVRRLAAAGYAALAPDLFRGKVFEYSESVMNEVFALLKMLSDDALLADVRAAIGFLRAQSEVEKQPLGTVGFCMGGRLSFLSDTEFGSEIGASVSFYGGSIAPPVVRVFPGVIDRAPKLAAPILLHYGADDDSIAPEEISAVAAALAREKKDFTIAVYPHAGHGFASVDRASYVKDVAERAWTTTLAFFEAHLSG
jgi:carboxymethylenebutenolidase